jgi:beta-RFAP synthase
MTDITIRTGARLHFGLFARGQSACREFGGIGAMIDRPGFELRVSRAEVDELERGIWQPRVVSLLNRLRGANPVGPLRVEIPTAPPAHAGFGSGTQLGMALAQAVSLLAGEIDVPPSDLARRAGRGMRSAIGLYGFVRGGLLVEAGYRKTGDISPLVAHAALPEEWRFLLIRPLAAQGISGADEVGGFARLGPMPLATTDRLCRLALMEIVPAVIEHDYDAACRAIGEFGRLVGEYFAPVQGGVFADARIRRLESLLMDRQLTGYGQSSWGPTLFVLCPHADYAYQLAGELSAAPDASECEISIATPLNRGAAIAILEA